MIIEPLKLIPKFLFSLMLLMLSSGVWAEAGRVIFVYGEVTAVGNNGIIRKLEKRGEVEAGETIRTSRNSLVQIRMIDKAMIALRSNSEIRIESYELGASKEQDSGIFELLKGGFRAVTGIIGKRLKSAYKMRTSTATIGIRGTDYTARLCQQDCNQAFGNLRSAAQIADGLYVGVNDGGITLTNQLGTLDLDELQYGYVKDATTAPVALLNAPEFLYFNSRPPNPDDEQSDSGTESGNATDSTVATRTSLEPANADLNTDETIQQDVQVEQVEVSQQQIEQNVIVDQVAETSSGSEFSLTEGVISSSRMIVTSYGNAAAPGSIASVYSNPYSTSQFSGNELQTFDNDYIDGGIGRYTHGTTSTIDLGYDPATGIAWGRWHAGVAQFESQSGQVIDLDLSTSNSTSLHWVSSPDQAATVALPSSGSASYQLVGNTSPTDNLGQIGILGNATLNANFTNMSVDTSVAVGINNQVWNGAASGLSINANGGFQGNLDTVNVTVGAAGFTGSGEAGGFFTSNGDGAGLGFSLEADINGTDTTVTGTAIFQKN